jgi:hypothetical protein
MQELHHLYEDMPLWQISDALNGKGDRIIGACIEGDSGSQYLREELVVQKFVVENACSFERPNCFERPNSLRTPIFCQTVTSLDVPVNSKVTMSSVNQGKELKNLEEITQEHLNFGQKGTLKETIVKGFPHENFFATQVYVILYYLSQFLHNPDFSGNNGGDLQIKRMHVHVHRGAGMGPTHLQLLKRKLISKLDLVESVITHPVRDDNMMIFDNTNVIVCHTKPVRRVRVILTFGYGYKHDELAPLCTEADRDKPQWWIPEKSNDPSYVPSFKAYGRGKPGWKPEKICVDFYYSISLIVGFDPQMTSGQTNIPRKIAKLDNITDPATLFVSNEEIRKIPNDLTSEWPNILAWLEGLYQHMPDVINQGMILQLTGAIYNPKPDTTIRVDYGWPSLKK